MPLASMFIPCVGPSLRPTRQAGLLHVTVVAISFLNTCVLTSLAVAESVEGTIITGRTKAKDGDSVLIGFGRGTIDARLHGIDAPEFDQECKDQDGKTWRCGTDTAKALAGLVDGRQLRCEVTDLEKSGARRPIVRCFDGVINISAEMIRRGWRGLSTGTLKSLTTTKPSSSLKPRLANGASAFGGVRQSPRGSSGNVDGGATHLVRRTAVQSSGTKSPASTTRLGRRATAACSRNCLLTLRPRANAGFARMRTR